MSYEPFVLPQTNVTLHVAALYRATLDCSAWASTVQRLVDLAPHLGHFCVYDIWLHGDVCGFSANGKPLISMGWSKTSSSLYVDIVAASTNVPAEKNRFLELTVLGSVASPANVVPAPVPIVARVGTKAGSSLTGASFVQPAVGGSVSVSLSASASWPIANGTVYVGSAGSYSTYTVTATTPSVAPYTALTLQLVNAGPVPPGGTIPSGTSIVAAAQFSVFIKGRHRRARW